MRPIRVAHLVTSLVAGGAQLQELALTEGLPRDRFQIEFLALGGRGEYDDRARVAGAAVHYLGTRRRPGESALTGSRRRAAMLGNYIHVVRRNHYDIIDAWLYPDDVLAATLRVATSTPIVMSGRRNIQSHDRFGPFGPSVDKLVDRLTDAVVANSTAAAENAVRSHHTTASKLRIIRNGVDLVEPLSAAERSAWRQRMSVRHDDVVIGCVGRYHRIKRHALLIEAFARLAPEHRDLSLVIVGEGDQRLALEQQLDEAGLRDRVRLHGNERDPRPMYGAFDIVAQASWSEGLPNALLEAAAAGCPVVATDAGGTPEIVVDGLTGLVVPIEDVDALADALRRLAADSGLREQMGRAARDHVGRTFAMSRFVEEYGDLYQELATAKGLRL